MNRLLSLAVFALFLACGCRHQEPATLPERPKDMWIGDLEFSATLNPTSTSHSNQGEIQILFRLKNHSSNQSLAPMIGLFPCTLILKNAADGKEDTIRWTSAPRPGLPRLPEDPEFNLEPGQVWSSGIPLQTYSGSIDQGKYSIKLKFESSKYPFATDWMDFEIRAESSQG